MYMNGEIVKMSFEGQNLQKLANGLNFNDLKKRSTPGIILPLPRGYIHA